jgi:hypothetical protein
MLVLEIPYCVHLLRFYLMIMTAVLQQCGIEVPEVKRGMMTGRGYRGVMLGMGNKILEGGRGRSFVE